METSGNQFNKWCDRRWFLEVLKGLLGAIPQRKSQASWVDGLQLVSDRIQSALPGKGYFPPALTGRSTSVKEEGTNGVEVTAQKKVLHSLLGPVSCVPLNNTPALSETWMSKDGFDKMVQNPSGANLLESED